MFRPDQVRKNDRKGKRMALIAAGAILGCSSLVACDNDTNSAPQAPTNTTTIPPRHESQLQTPEQAARSIVNGVESCKIISAKYNGRFYDEPINMDSITAHLTLKLLLTPQSLDAYGQYDQDDSVVWETQTMLTQPFIRLKNGILKPNQTMQTLQAGQTNSEDVTAIMPVPADITDFAVYDLRAVSYASHPQQMNKGKLCGVVHLEENDTLTIVPEDAIPIGVPEEITQ